MGSAGEFREGMDYVPRSDWVVRIPADFPFLPQGDSIYPGYPIRIVHMSDQGIQGVGIVENTAQDEKPVLRIYGKAESIYKIFMNIVHAHNLGSMFQSIELTAWDEDLEATEIEP